MDDIGKKINAYMEQTFPEIGQFILNKQCRDLGLDPTNLKKEDLVLLSERLSHAVEMFIGYEKSKEFKQIILTGKF